MKKLLVGLAVIILMLALNSCTSLGKKEKPIRIEIPKVWHPDVPELEVYYNQIEQIVYMNKGQWDLILRYIKENEEAWTALFEYELHYDYLSPQHPP